MSSHGVRCNTQNDPTSFDSILLNPRVRSLLLTYHRERKEGKEACSDCKFNEATFNARRREESRGEFKRKTISFGVDFRPDGEESKEDVCNRKGVDSSHVTEFEANGSRTNDTFDNQRGRVHARARALYHDSTGSTFQRICSSESQDDQSMVTTYRKFLDFEARRLQRQRQRLGVASGENDRIIQNYSEKIKKKVDSRVPSVSKVKAESPKFDPFPSNAKSQSRDPRISPATKFRTKSAAFDPFASTIVKSHSWDKAKWPVSDFDTDVIEKGKCCDVSRQVNFSRDTGNASNEGHTIPLNEIADSTNKPRNKSVESNKNGELKTSTVLLDRHSLTCGNNRHKSTGQDSGPKSLSTADHTSVRSGSSWDTPASSSGHNSRINSKIQKYFEMKEKKRLNFASSFLKPKTTNKEWLRTSVESDGGGQRKRDQKMKEWLSTGNAPGAELFQEPCRSGMMETVFYDTRQKNLEDQ